MKICVSVMAFLAASVCGCDTGKRSSLQDEFETMSRERSGLKRQVERLQKENEELTGRIERLAALPAEVKMEALPEVDRIELGRRTGLHDKDDDGVQDTLVVYVKPYDSMGDTVKSAGSVKVSLWDLNSGSEGAQLGSWEVSGGNLKGLWAGTFLTNYYRLTFELGELVVGEEGELTLSVIFTDYIGGKVLTAQKVIKP